jgi:hypothetical protein
VLVIVTVRSASKRPSSSWNRIFSLIPSTTRRNSPDIKIDIGQAAEHIGGLSERPKN